MTIEDLLADLTDRGWYLYSMYHHPLDRPGPYQWETTVRCHGPPPLSAHGQGPTLFDALSQAINNIERASPFVAPTFTVSSNETPLAKVMSNLLKPEPKATITRRI